MKIILAPIFPLLKSREIAVLPDKAKNNLKENTLFLFFCYSHNFIPHAVLQLILKAFYFKTNVSNDWFNVEDAAFNKEINFSSIYSADHI